MARRATSANRAAAPLYAALTAARARLQAAINHLAQVNLHRAERPNQFHQVRREQMRKLRRVDSARAAAASAQRRYVNAMARHENSLHGELARAMARQGNNEARLMRAVNMRMAAHARRRTPSPNVARRYGPQLKAWYNRAWLAPHRKGFTAAASRYQPSVPRENYNRVVRTLERATGGRWTPY